MVFRHTRNDEDVLISLSVAPKLPVSVELALVATTMLFAFFGSLLERLEEGGGGSHLQLVPSPPPRWAKRIRTIRFYLLFKCKVGVG